MIDIYYKPNLLKKLIDWTSNYLLPTSYSIKTNAMTSPALQLQRLTILQRRCDRLIKV